MLDGILVTYATNNFSEMHFMQLFHYNDLFFVIELQMFWKEIFIAILLPIDF